MTRYEIIIYWSQADEAFIAEVPELPGCAADGKTYKEALANVEIIIQEWIETAKELGRPIPAPAAALPSLKSQRPHPLKNQTPKGAPPNSKACPTRRGEVVNFILQTRAL